MSPRVWTADELARVWPLPVGWIWHCEEGMDWLALHTPSMVMALAVIGAHQGRDSVEAFVAEMESAAEQCRASATAADADACLSAAIAFEVCADGLRLGVAKR
jgi:hypothetical protein